ncbi:MAG TPA: hypothetical protein DCS31_07065 [Candidatus Competibacteraceae bacterium]|nr:hypothetical protein [Candidatus Competibacteraceae bacterium]
MANLLLPNGSAPTLPGIREFASQRLAVLAILEKGRIRPVSPARPPFHRYYLPDIAISAVGRSGARGYPLASCANISHHPAKPSR